MQISGLYRVTYQLKGKIGKGVVYLANGQVRGGSSVMFYSGTYSFTDETMTIDVRVSRHSNHPDLIPIDGLDDFRISGTGQNYGGVVTITADISGLPDEKCNLTFERLAD